MARPNHLAHEVISDDVDPDWATHVIAVYTDPNFEWSTDKWRLGDEVRRSALESIATAGRPLTRDELSARGITATQLRYLSRVTDAPSGEPILWRVSSKRNAPYALLDCPHCDGKASVSVVTPETRPGVLCPDCGRAPRPGSPVFPPWYRT